MTARRASARLANPAEARIVVGTMVAPHIRGSSSERGAADEGIQAMTNVLGVVLLVVGILALAYGGVTYTPQAPEPDVGPVEITVALGFVGGGLLARRRRA